jgi:hypothetical protein
MPLERFHPTDFGPTWLTEYPSCHDQEIERLLRHVFKPYGPALVVILHDLSNPCIQVNSIIDTEVLCVVCEVFRGLLLGRHEWDLWVPGVVRNCVVVIRELDVKVLVVHCPDATDFRVCVEDFYIVPLLG